MSHVVDRLGEVESLASLLASLLALGVAGDLLGLVESLLGLPLGLVAGGGGVRLLAETDFLRADGGLLAGVFFGVDEHCGGGWVGGGLGCWVRHHSSTTTPKNQKKICLILRTFGPTLGENKRAHGFLREPFRVSVHRVDGEEEAVVGGLLDIECEERVAVSEGVQKQGERGFAGERDV